MNIASGAGFGMVFKGDPIENGLETCPEKPVASPPASRGSMFNKISLKSNTKTGPGSNIHSPEAL